MDISDRQLVPAEWHVRISSLSFKKKDDEPQLTITRDCDLIPMQEILLEELQKDATPSIVVTGQFNLRNTDKSSGLPSLPGNQPGNQPSQSQSNQPVRRQTATTQQLDSLPEGLN